jgi:beta-glucosidase
VIVAIAGEMPYAEGAGDRTDLGLSPQDIALVHQAKQAGCPVVTILISGRPMILGSVLDDSDALLEAWLPGTEGTGVADVLFGDFHPTGKLPITWPREMRQVPIHSGQQGGEAALFPYGYGLTY